MEGLKKGALVFDGRKKLGNCWLDWYRCLTCKEDFPKISGHIRCNADIITSCPYCTKENHMLYIVYLDHESRAKRTPRIGSEQLADIDAGLYRVVIGNKMAAESRIKELMEAHDIHGDDIVVKKVYRNLEFRSEPVVKINVTIID